MFSAGTAIYARFKEEQVEESDYESSEEDENEDVLSFKAKKESAKLTQAILEQFNHLNTEDPFTESSKSRKSSLTESLNSRKTSISETSSSRKSSLYEVTKSRKSSLNEASKSEKSSANEVQSMTKALV